MNAVPSAFLTVIRPMREADVPDIVAIERQAYDFPWSEGIFRDCISVGYSGWVHLASNELAGYAIMAYGAGEAHVLNLCVAPDWQGQGIGARLLKRLMRDAHRLGAETMFLEVRPSNHPALRLYLHEGFQQVGLRRDYYPAHDGREDALVMRRRLRGKDPDA